MNSRGSIQERGRGWWLRYSEKQSDGSTIRRRLRLGDSATIRSHAAARKLADAWLARNRPETSRAAPAVLCAEVFERFLRVSVINLRTSSKTRYTRLLRALALPMLASLPVAELDTARLQEHFAALIGQGVARSTLISLRSVMLRALDEARSDGIAVCEINRARLKIGAAAAARRMLPISARELQRILEASTWPERALFAVLGFSGLRIGEALGLRWSDIDLKAGTISIAQQVVAGKLVLPKTSSSISVLPMLPQLVDVLLEFRGQPYELHGLLFRNRFGQPLLAHNVHARWLHPIFERLGMPKRGFHAFRHGLPRILADAGVSADVIRRLLRHSSLAMTQRYMHAEADDLRDAVENAGARLPKVNKIAQPRPKLAQSANGHAFSRPPHAWTKSEKEL